MQSFEELSATLSRTDPQNLVASGMPCTEQWEPSENAEVRAATQILINRCRGRQACSTGLSGGFGSLCLYVEKPSGGSFENVGFRQPGFDS